MLGPEPFRWPAWLLVLLAVLVAPLLGACASGPDAASRDESGELIVVAVAEVPSSLPAVGGSARGDYRRARYFGSDAALAVAQDLAREHGLTELAAWTIQPLSLRCMLYRLPAGARRDAVLARLQGDARVALAQPSNHFETLAHPPTPLAGLTGAVAATNPAPQPALPTPAQPATGTAYNDPFLHLQHGLVSVGALTAQQWGQGERVTVAVIDGAVDTQHPDLAGRTSGARDYVRGSEPGAAAGIDRHGTAVAGVIAAAANNGIGIVGVAPRATLLPLRACWPLAAGGARCSTFTLAQALVAAVASGADVINLSLGGPRDPLLEQLTGYALSRGVVVVGALPLSGVAEGFPAGVPGVLVAAAAEGAAHAGSVAAPGRRIFTLAPGAGYAYHDGSSMAAAHVSGAAALLRSIQPGLAAGEIRRLLSAPRATAAAVGPEGATALRLPETPPMALCSAAQRVAGLGERVARAC